MTKIILAMCIIPVYIETNYIDYIITQGVVIKTNINSWTIDVTDSLVAGGYGLKINSPTIRKVSPNDCQVIKK